MSVFLNWDRNKAIGEARSSLASSFAPHSSRRSCASCVVRPQFEVGPELADQFCNRLGVGLLVVHVGLLSPCQISCRRSAGSNEIRCDEYGRTARSGKS